MINNAVKVKKLRVYIAGPISLGDRTLNLRAAILAGDAVLRAGHLPFIPHLNDLWHLVCPHPAEDWYEWDNYWLSICDVLIRLPGESAGSDKEVELAKSCGLLVCSLEDFLQYFGRETGCGDSCGKSESLRPGARLFPGPRRVHDNEASVAYDSGATMSPVEGRYDLICPTGLRRLAERYALGAKKHGDMNWCRAGADPAFQRARLNHLIKHVVDYLQNGNSLDDNLAAIAWGAFALMHYEEQCRHHEQKLP